MLSAPPSNMDLCTYLDNQARILSMNSKNLARISECVMRGVRKCRVSPPDLRLDYVYNTSELHYNKSTLVI